MVATPDFLPQTRLLDVDDYDRLPDDGPRYELIDGVLTEMPAPTIFHQSVLAQYFEMLRAHVRQHRLGLVLFAPVDVELSRFDIVQPDLVFVSRDNAGVIRPDGRRIVGAPDLVVEASSPGTTLRDQGAKRRLFATHGVREYWFVDTDRRAQTTWVREGDRLVEWPSEEGRHASVALPGLVVEVAAILARADEDVAMVESPEEGVDGR
jgi:Uma2 family endonuclease